MSDRPPPESPAPAPPAPAPGRSADSEERALPALAADHQLELLEEQQGGKQKTDELARDPAELAQRLADSRAPAGSESRGGSRIRSAETAPQATRQFSGRGAGAGGAATSALESQLDRTSRDDALTNRAQVRRFMFRGGRSEGESAPTGPPATVLWDPLIQASDGTATAEFDVPPDTQTLQLLAFAHAGTRFGTLRETVTVNPPVSLETHELAGLHVGDTFQLPVVITNRTTGPVELGLKLTSNQLLQPEMAGAAAAVQVPVPAQSAVTYSLPAQLAVDAGAAEMSLETSVAGKTLAAKWRGDIAPAAPVVAWDTSGVLTSGEPQAVALELPAAAAEVDVQLRGWPSVAAELRDRVRSLGEALSPADPRLDEFADSVRLWNRNYGISDPDLLATASRLKKLAADNATAEASLAAIDNFRAETLGLRPPGDPQRSNAALKFEARESAAEGLQQLFESEGRSALTTGPVTLDVHLDQQQLAELQVPGSSAQSLTWHDRFDVADQGPAALGLTMQGAEQMPYRLNLNAYLAAEQVKRLGPGQDSLGFQVDTHLSTQAIRPGEATDLVLQLRRAEPRTIQAVVPLPGGVELDQQQARDELARAGLILQSRDKHRLRLTWPAPDPGQATDEAVEVRLRLRGVVPGRYTAPPATAYETGQRPGFAQPLTLEIASP